MLKSCTLKPRLMGRDACMHRPDVFVDGKAMATCAANPTPRSTRRYLAADADVTVGALLANVVHLAQPHARRETHNSHQQRLETDRHLACLTGKSSLWAYQGKGLIRSACTLCSRHQQRSETGWHWAGPTGNKCAAVVPIRQAGTGLALLGTSVQLLCLSDRLALGWPYWKQVCSCCAYEGTSLLRGVNTLHVCSATAHASAQASSVHVEYVHGSYLACIAGHHMVPPPPCEPPAHMAARLPYIIYGL
eukprot:365208-Chlamydomonas_euryale.AAC.16